MDNFIKVDRVSTVDEALELQDLGADIIGVSFNDNPIYADNRVLDLDSISQINDILTTSKLVVEVSPNYKGLLELINYISPSYIQISGTELLPIKEAIKLSEKGIGIVYAGIEASYEDDPSWILSKYINTENINTSFYQIDLLADIENSWEFFKLESPNYPEELQISDIVKLGEQFPLILSLDFRKDNILEIMSNFSSVKGISLSISEKVSKENTHWFSYSSIVDILKVINR